MNLLETKRKLIDTIEATSDETLLVELMDVLQHHDNIVRLTEEQNTMLKERINRVEEGRATYYNAREEADKIKKNLNEL